MTNIKNQTKKNRKQQMKYKFICKKVTCLSVGICNAFLCLQMKKRNSNKKILKNI